MAEYKIKWIEPPASRRGLVGRTSELPALLDQLRAHPGQWARIVTRSSSSSTAADLKAGRAPGAAPGEFEVTSRSVGKTNGGSPLFDVYARYVGGDGQE